MRSKLLRAIFPDRDAIAYNQKLHLVLPSPSGSANSPATSAFSQVLPQASGNLASSLGGLLAGNNTSTNNGSSAVLETVSNNLDRLRLVTESHITETQANTAALTSNTTAKNISQAVSSVTKASGGLLSGFSALPLVSGLLQLFGGGANTKQTQAPLPKYNGPAAAYFDSAVESGSNGGTLQQASYDQFGNPRQMQAVPAPSVPSYSSLVAIARNTVGDPSSAPFATGSSNANLADPAATTPAANVSQVTVNIQAMDSRSFLDRSQDIAQAVREAMLNMHSINDVVNDL